MNGMMLYEAMGRIRPTWVEEAEKQTFAKPLWRRMLPMAACLAVIFGLSAGLLHWSGADVTDLIPQLSQTAAPERPDAACCDLCAVNPKLHLFARWMDELLWILCAAWPVVGIAFRMSRKKVHAISAGLYLAYLLACVVYVWLSVTYAWWSGLEQQILSMLHGSLVLLAVLGAVNGLCYLPDWNRVRQRLDGKPSDRAKRWWAAAQYIVVCLSAASAVVLAVYYAELDLWKGEYDLVEAEFPLVAAVGFGVLTLVFAVFLFKVYRNRKPRTGLLSFILQWVFTLLAFRWFLAALAVQRDTVTAMYTETVSWALGSAGMCWGASILCMIIGIWELLRASAPKSPE